MSNPSDKLSILEAFKLSKLDENTKRIDGLVDKLLTWFKTPVKIPVVKEYPVEKLDRIIDGLEKLVAIEREERKEERRDDWMDTYEFDLSTARDKEIIPIPFTAVDISSITCIHLDDDFTLWINGDELKFTTTMTLRNYDLKSVAITNSASSGYVRLFVQGKRKKS